jgi:DNA-binding XRE family transcriptional regulator
MPRPPKNPDNAIVHLRSILGLTQKQLAKRTRISIYSLKDIEDGTYRLSETVARRISKAVCVSAKSLLRNERPLLDQWGEPFGPDSYRKLANTDFRAKRASAEQLFAILLDEIWEGRPDAGKKRGDLLRDQPLFYFEFNDWMVKMAEQFRIKEKILSRIEDAALQGAIFLVPAGLLPAASHKRQEWLQAFLQARKDVENERIALEEKQFEKEYPQKAEELRILKAKETLSTSQQERLGQLHVFRAFLGFGEPEDAEAWRTEEAPRLKLGLPALSLREAASKPSLLRRQAWRSQLPNPLTPEEREKLKGGEPSGPSLETT